MALSKHGEKDLLSKELEQRPLMLLQGNSDETDKSAILPWGHISYLKSRESSLI